MLAAGMGVCFIVKPGPGVGHVWDFAKLAYAVDDNDDDDLCSMAGEVLAVLLYCIVLACVGSSGCCARGQRLVS